MNTVSVSALESQMACNYCFITVAADQILFEEAMKYGYVESRSLSSLLIGAAGAGKTHVKHLIFKKPPPRESVSTPLAERPVRAVRVARLGGKTDDDWSEIDDEKLDNMLAQAMNAGVQLSKKGKIVSIARKIIPLSWRKSSKFSYPIDGEVDDPEPTDEAIMHASSLDSDGMAQVGSIHSNTISRLALLRAVQAETKKLLDKVSTSRQSVGLVPEQLTGVVDWIYLLDSGGQRHFHEILPAFLPHVSVAMFVLKLCESLEHVPIAEYRTKEGKYRLDSSFTNKDILSHCSQTIQSLQGETTTPSSKVVVIGTHRDLESEPREQKNAQLIQLFSPIFDKHLVYHGEHLKELIFPVNAKTPEKKDKDVAQELRKVILDAASHVQRKKTPISWFVLEQMIHRMASKLGRGILSRDECLLIAEYLDIQKKHVDAMLNHFASLNTLHYYRNILPEAVFSDPQVILDKISELVQTHCKLNSKPDQTKATTGDFRRFRDEGCINVKLLSRFPKHYTDLFTPDSFLMILVDRLIAAQQIGVDNYFMPSLLPMLKHEELSFHRVDSSSSAAPFVIYFQEEWAPFGIFCALVAFLRSSHNFNLWELSPNPDLIPTQPNCLTRNCVEFQLPDNAPGTVTLIDSLTFFEVHVNAPRSVCSQLCHTIRQMIIDGLHKAAETLHYQRLNFEVAFFCEDSHKSSNSDEDDSESTCIASHVARVWKRQWWKCSINAQISAKLEERHLLWFEATNCECCVLPTINEPIGFLSKKWCG